MRILSKKYTYVSKSLGLATHTCALYTLALSAGGTNDYIRKKSKVKTCILITSRGIIRI